MSEVRVNDIVDYGGKGAPTFDNGAVISGITTSDHAVVGSNVTLTSGGVNVSGVTTAVELSGDLTGDINSGFVTATSAIIGSGVTINAGGFNVTGIISATSYVGDGSSLTGAAVTIAPLTYNPDVNDTQVTKATGIGITFDHRLIAGSGNITLSVSNAGAAGTVVENFGVGSSVTIDGRNVSFTPSSALNQGETYHISYPSGAFTNTSGDTDSVGTAYTFGVEFFNYELWSWGYNSRGQLGLNNTTQYSSPVQVPGTTWTSGKIDGYYSGNWYFGIKTDGTLWTWGFNGNNGQLGLNNQTDYSSPTQIPGTTWSKAAALANGGGAIKTDGTLWIWGGDGDGQLAQNTQDQHRSSPVQVPGTTWSLLTGSDHVSAIKTDGTLWAWGDNGKGELGQNNTAKYSSPVQIPGTTWSKIDNGRKFSVAIKTDGTLWSWGYGYNGNLGQNTNTNAHKSSPVQVGSDTTWSKVSSGMTLVAAIKTDGTLWSWGDNQYGQGGVNNRTYYSSPVQIPGTTWSKAAVGQVGMGAIKTDGTLWMWGRSSKGELAQNNEVAYSSPVQVPGTTWDQLIPGGDQGRSFGAIKKI